jgi:organic radical activating enzyme
MSKTFCVNPWATLHYNMGEKFSPCCLFKGELPANSITEYVNSTQLSDIKNSLLTDVQIPGCKSCWDHELQGHESKRLRDNRTYETVFKLKYQKQLHTPSSEFVEYYIRLGNHCNIRCTSCNDTCSSGWISENKKFNLPARPVINIDSADPIWQHLRENANTIGAIEFIGGEPFMMNEREQADLFKFFVETNNARHIKLKYNTNGTRLPVEQVEYWSKFKHIEINISMDGIGSRFEYLRYPAIWSEVENNLKFYQELQAKIPQLSITIVHTLSILNIGYVNEMVDYCRKHNLNIFFNMLSTPARLNLFKAPIKEWIVDRIKSVDDIVIQNIAKNINTQPATTTPAELLHWCRELDTKRNLSIDKTFTELVEALT